MYNTVVLISKNQDHVDACKKKHPFFIHVNEDIDHVSSDLLVQISNKVMTKYFALVINNFLSDTFPYVHYTPSKYNEHHVHIWSKDEDYRLYNRLEILKNPNKYDDNYVFHSKHKMVKHIPSVLPPTATHIAPMAVDNGSIVSYLHTDAKGEEYYYKVKQGHYLSKMKGYTFKSSLSWQTLSPEDKSQLKRDKNSCISYPIFDEAKGEIVGHGGVTLHRRGNKDTIEIKRFETDIYTYYQPFDIFFISYDEPFREQNFETLKKRYPTAQHINGIEGIPQAHIECAKRSSTPYFYVVDADCKLADSFELDHFYPAEELNVYVWKAKNPLNGLVYGYGGVKLMSKRILDIYDPNKQYTDFATTIADGKFKSMPNISNITTVDYDQFFAWRSGFRETAKLTLANLKEHNYLTQKRIDAWLAIEEKDSVYSSGKNGAHHGHQFAINYQNDPEKIKLINDFGWIKKEYERLTK